MSKKTTEEEKRYYPLDWDEAAIVGLTNQGEPVVEDVSIPVDTRQRLFSPNVRVQPMGGSAPEAKPDPAVQTELERRLAETQSMLAGMQASADIAAQQQAAQDAYAGHFANLLAQNEAYRQQQSQLWEQREKESRSRQTIAAVSDALSSLGNLVGTSKGALNQPQTYQMPFLQRGVDLERALARNTADRIRATDLSLSSTAASVASKQDSLAGKLAMQQLKNANSERIAHINGQYGLQRIAMQQAGMNERNEAQLGYRERQDAIRNRLSAKKVQISQAKLDEITKYHEELIKKRGYQELTANAKRQYLRDTARQHAAELTDELKKGNVVIPWNWEQLSWSQKEEYLSKAPIFYEKYYGDEWKRLGGSGVPVDDDDLHLEDEDDLRLS